MIDRSETWDTPLRTVAFEVELLFGIHVAEPILASLHVRAQQQAGHMNASDPIKTTIRVSCKEGAVCSTGSVEDRLANLLEAQSPCGTTIMNRRDTINGSVRPPPLFVAWVTPV